MMFPLQELTDLPWRPLREQTALIHHIYPVRPRNDILQPVLRQNYGSADIPVNLSHRFQKIRSRDRIKLRSRLIQNQKFRVHSHDRRQI